MNSSSRLCNLINGMRCPAQRPLNRPTWLWQGRTLGGSTRFWGHPVSDLSWERSGVLPMTSIAGLHGPSAPVRPACMATPTVGSVLPAIRRRLPTGRWVVTDVPKCSSHQGQSVTTSITQIRHLDAKLWAVEFCFCYRTAPDRLVWTDLTSAECSAGLAGSTVPVPATYFPPFWAHSTWLVR